MTSNVALTAPERFVSIIQEESTIKARLVQIRKIEYQKLFSELYHILNPIAVREIQPFIRDFGSLSTRWWYNRISVIANEKYGQPLKWLIRGYTSGATTKVGDQISIVHWDGKWKGKPSPYIPMRTQLKEACKVISAEVGFTVDISIPTK